MITGWLFWCPTRANHSVLRAFKFHSPSTEEAFQQRNGQLRVMVAAAYLTVASAINGINCLSYWGSVILPVPFWCFLACCVLQAMALAALGAFPALRRQALLLHAVMVVFCIGIHSYLGLALADEWLATAILSLQNNFDPNVVEEVSNILVVAFGNHSRTMMAFSCQLQLISLSFMGFNYTSIPIWASFITAFVVAAAVAPQQLVISTALYASQLLLAIIPFVFVCICIEVLNRCHFYAQLELKRELEISQIAEGMLHSTTKNVLSDAAANIQAFLNGNRQAPGFENVLFEALAGLTHGMRSCRQRQAFLALVSDTYEPHFCQVSLRDFGEEVVAGRPVARDFADGQVLIDPLLCSLVLENAIDQAFQLQKPDAPDIQVRIYQERLHGVMPLVAHNAVQVVFEVGFLCREDIDVQPDNRMLRLQAGPLSTYFTSQRHLIMAADAHQMAVVWLKDEEHLTFRATYHTVQAASPQRPSVSTPRNLVDAFPSGLTFYVIDDSIAARRMMASCISQLAAPSAVHCFGAHPEEVHQFVSAASQEADIVVCDQHLDYEDQHYLGTDLVRSLRDRGFRGLLCIRSSDMAEPDRELYSACGAHCMFGKEVLAKDVVNGLKAAYVQLKGMGPAEEMVLSSCTPSHSPDAGPSPVVLQPLQSWRMPGSDGMHQSLQCSPPAEAPPPPPPLMPV